MNLFGLVGVTRSVTVPVAYAILVREPKACALPVELAAPPVFQVNLNPGGEPCTSYVLVLSYTKLKTCLSLLVVRWRYVLPPVASSSCTGR